MPIEIAHSPLAHVQSFQAALDRMHGSDARAKRTAIEAAEKLVLYVTHTFTKETYKPPTTGLILPGSGHHPLTYDMPENISCFKAARCCLTCTTPLHTSAVAAAMLPPEFTPLGMVKILDDLKYYESKNNPLCPINPFSCTLPEEWRDNLRRWAGVCSFANIAACLANDLGRIVFHAHIAGLKHFKSIDVVPQAQPAEVLCGDRICSTATEAVLQATKVACDFIRSSGIGTGTSESIVRSDDLAVSWKWLLDRGLMKLLPLAQGSSGLQRLRNLISQEERALGKAAGAAPPTASEHRILTDRQTKAVVFDGRQYEIESPIAFKVFAALVDAHNSGATPITADALYKAAKLANKDPRPNREFAKLPKTLAKLIRADSVANGGYSLQLPVQN